MEKEEILQLEIKGILKKRIPKNKRRWIPPFIISYMERLIRQKELNEILRATWPAKGSEFASEVMKFLNISIEVKGLEHLKEGERYMFAANHPLGGLDGIALISVFGNRYGDENIRFLVNDLLLNVTPLKDVFLPVNKYGKQARENTIKINEKMASDCQMFQFPAGLCSRLHDNGEISDLEWQKSFVVKAIEYHRDIIPVHFEGKNSNKFYKTARRRKKLGIKFNLEQVLLPSEICKSRGKKYVITIGAPLSWRQLKESGKSSKELAADIRKEVYDLNSKDIL